MLSKSEIVSVLEQNVCTIHYSKVSGEKAVMRGTLMESHLPARSGFGSPKKNDEVVNVFNVDKGEWRSFRTDKLDGLEVCQVA